MSTPDTIILDLNKSVRALQQRIDRASGDGDGYVNKIIEDVVDCLWNKSSAMSSLMTYAEAQRHQQVDRARNSSAEMIAWDIVEFGRDLYEQLVTFGIYRNDRLRYVFSGRCRTHNVMLTYVPANELY
jgi:D-lyxose ketol-isomerase